MRELTARDPWTADGEADSSQYARMIPGTSATLAARTQASAKKVIAIHEVVRKFVLRRIFTRLLPHPIADAFPLYRDVAVDLIVLSMACFLQGVLFPASSLPPLSQPLFAILITLFGFSEGIYRNTFDPFPEGTVPGIGRSVSFATMLIFLANRDATVARAIPTTIAFSLGGLLLYRRVSQFAWARRSHETESRRVLIVGAGPVARSIARALRADPLQHAVVHGFVADDSPLSSSVLGRIADLEWLARAEFIDEVILAIPDEPVQMREAAEIAFRNHLDIRAVPDLPCGPWSEAGVEHLGQVPIVTLHREPVPGATLFLKRVLDIAGAAAGLVLTAPLLVMVALLIRLESAGPVIYAAERTGVKGLRFRCYKFRSMVTNADHLKDDLRAQNQREGPIFKIIHDPRITRVGRFIRRYSLDELPQLWNVLRGDMSLVGPRPHPIDDVNHYELHHYRRLDMKPGITGLWQVTARQSPSFDLNMHLDLTYIENWTLRLDMRILFTTVRVLFSAEGV